MVHMWLAKHFSCFVNFITPFEHVTDDVNYAT